MPAKSQAQARKIYMLYKRGKLTREEMLEYLKGVKVKDLPKRLHPKKRKKSRKANAARRAAKKLRRRKKRRRKRK